MSVNSGTIKKVLITVIMAVILLAILSGGLTTLIITSVHNLSDSLSADITTVGGPSTLATFVGNVDDYFLWGIAASIVIFLLALAFGLFAFGYGKYKRYRGGRNSYRRY